MATESQKEELIAKIGSLVNSHYNGDYAAAFSHYDSNQDGKINKSELLKLLEDAGIGDWFTRGLWASGIMTVLDTDNDGKIELPELLACLGK